MSSLIVGSTSQLSHYFPKSFERISSRDYSAALDRSWDSVYICFGENRTYLANSMDRSVASLFYKVNCDMVVEAVEAFVPIAKRVVVYSTAELWNDTCGGVSPSMPHQFKSNHYIMSKYAMTMKLRDKKSYPNVSVAYPFNFNGVYRSGDFLFGKVFDSILNAKPIVLGDTYYYRDILHPSMAAIESMSHEVGEDFMIGSGRVVFVNDLIRELYKQFDLSYSDMVEERWESPSHYRNRIFYSANPCRNPTNQTVFELMVRELKGASNES